MEKKYKLGYTTGVFDLFHVGHLNILEQAKEMCDTLIVGVTTDELCYKRKGKFPMIPHKDRIKIVEAIRYVDKVISQEDMDKYTMVKKLGADAVFVGTDWKGTESWIRYEKEFASIGCDVVYIDHTDGVSSTVLQAKIRQND